MSNEFEDKSLEKLTADLGRVAQSTDTTPRPGFKEALLLRLRAARAKQRMPSFSWPKMLALASPVLVVLIIAVIVFQPFFGVRTVYAFDQFTLTPESADAAGVDEDSDFILESRDPVDKGDIEKLLTVKTLDNVAYSVETVSDRKLRIAFDETLSPDEIVKFNLATQTTTPDGRTVPRNYDWAFQVKADFQVTYSIPGEKASEVPLDTGFEFGFNYENIDPDEFERALTIEPTVSGHVERSRRTFVFVPSETLKPDTVYTVTLKGSLPLEGSDETLGEDYSFKFQTAVEGERGYSFNVGKRFLTVTPQTAVRLPVWRSDENDRGPVRVKVYPVGSFNNYLDLLFKSEELGWMYGITADDLVDTSSVTPAMEFETTLVQEDYQWYVVFPANVPAGYYVVDYEHGGARDWSMVQSSNLTSFVSRATNKTVVWVNDDATDQPVAGATVKYFNDDLSATTNGQGLAEIPAEENQSSIVEVRRGDEAVALVLQQNVVLEGFWQVAGNVESRDDYWSYLYTDRPTYRGTDTVEFWGYVERRESGARPERVCASLGIVEDVCVDVTPGGTFGGAIELQRAPAGYYQLDIFTVARGEPRSYTVASRGISISEYVKPAYTLSLETDVDAAFVGETVGYTVHGQYFEGTPVKGLSVTVNGECGEQTVTLDDQGNGRGSFICQYEEGRRYPQSVWLEARPARVEEGDISAGATITLFGPKVYLDLAWDRNYIQNQIGKIELTVRNVEAIDSHDPEIFGPTAKAGQTVRGQVTEITYSQEETGQYYDFVQKRVVKRYRYLEHKRLLTEFAVVSGEDGVATFDFPAANKEANYQVELTATDEFGRTDEKEVYLWHRQDVDFYETSNALSFWNEDAAADQWNFPGYSVNDTVHLAVYQGGKPFVVPEGGRFLYYQAHRGIQETKVADEPRYVFPFTQDDVPNTGVYGVLYFDGLFQIVGDQWWWDGGTGFPVAYDTSDSKLTVTLATGVAYHPGDEVEVSVHVEDKDGKPVEAEVNLNVVDEAYYAFFPEDVDTLASLYTWVQDGVIATAVTAEAEVAAFGAEKGGGGDRGLGRFTFKDTAAFDVVRTDEKGDGVFAFKLPDNITSWRVTAQALESDQKLAGDTTLNVDSSLPFFIDVVARDTYLEQDRPTVVARTAGTDIGLDDSVEWLVQVPDASFEMKTVKPASETLYFELPELGLGAHQVTVSAAVGDLDDRITRTVKIMPSRLVKPVVATTLFSGEGTVAGADDRYSEVTFLDGGSGKYYGELVELAGTGGDRADQALVRLMATRALNANFGETREEPEFRSELYWDGGVKLLPYASADRELTAKVALFSGDTPLGSVAGDFDSRLSDVGRSPLTPRETAQAFAALGAEGWPVLAELQRAAAVFGDDVDAELWTALGLEALGDGEGARKIYRQLIKETTERSGYVYLEGGELETTMERTALMAILAAGLGEPEAEKLYGYVTEQSQGKTLVVLEQMLFIQRAMENLPDEPARVEYTLRGERKSAELSKGVVVTELVSPEELATLSPRASSGQVMAVSRYLSAAVDPDAPRDRSIGVTRAYSGASGAATTFNAGDLIKVELQFLLPQSNCDLPWEIYQEGAVTPASSVPCETYQITDVVPSGLTVVTPRGSGTYEGRGTCYDWPADVQENRVTYFVTPRTETACRNGKFTYYARVVTPGVYLAEPVYIRSGRDPEQFNQSDVAILTINP